MTYPVSLVEWESRFFGFPIGGVEIPADYSPELLEESLREARTRFRLISITLKKIGPDLLRSGDVSCECYDRRLMLKKPVPKNVPHLDGHVKAYTASYCSKWLERLAVQAGTLTRFKRDPELSMQYERLFLTWINYSVSGELADSIWTWREENKHIGLVTIRNAKRLHPETNLWEHEGRIGMLSVDVEQRHRGVGTQLFEACDFWCSSLDIPTVAIAVPQENEAMMQLCKKLGFDIRGEESIYHYWSPGWAYDAHRGWIRLDVQKTSA